MAINRIPWSSMVLMLFKQSTSGGESGPASRPAGSEIPDQGICHELVQPWAAGLGPADGVLVGFHDTPTLAVGVLLDFRELKFGVLIGGTDARVDGGLIGGPLVLPNLND